MSSIYAKAHRNKYTIPQTSKINVDNRYAVLTQHRGHNYYGNKQAVIKSAPISSDKPKSCGPIIAQLHIYPGKLRKLKANEKIKAEHCWLVTEKFTCSYKCINKHNSFWRQVTVPAGFMCDGATNSPDIGRSWVFHDWLYACHYADDGLLISQYETDHLMVAIAKEENNTIFAWAVETLHSIDSFTQAWYESGREGPYMQKL